MKDFKYTTSFSSVIKPLVSEEKDKYLALASHVDIGDFVPDVNTDKNIDLKLEKAANSSEILSFINSLPNKFEYKLGEKGSKISGGQMQRIGLARALYPDPDLIILDEFTSSVDLDTEKKLMETLHKLKSKKLIIIISHREQTIKFSDNVLDLSKNN